MYFGSKSERNVGRIFAIVKMTQLYTRILTEISVTCSRSFTIIVHVGIDIMKILLDIMKIFLFIENFMSV